MKLIDINKPEISPDWKEKGYSLPAFDRKTVSTNTYSHPAWVHFGAGNIFRGLPAAALQRILDKGIWDKGVVVAEGFDYEIVTKAYRPFDNLSLLVLLKSDGKIEKQVIASVTESLIADPSGEDWKRLVSIFRDPAFRMASFTITEKGYSISDSTGEPLPFVKNEIENGPEKAVSMMGKLAALCIERFNAGKFPLALVSMDNCSHNGTKLKEGVLGIAKGWAERSFVPGEFIEYIGNPTLVSFPWSMIDKITPRPDESVREILTNEGFEDTQIIVTGKSTWTAPFVNAEEAEYLIIEDDFPNGRPPLEEGGLIFTDRETVDKVERMKVCTCLNPLHTALAVFGCLLSYDKISAEMNDPALLSLIKKLGFDEGLPVVTHPGIIEPEKFLKEVLETRLPNPFLPDTPQRIACDTSQKIPIRFGQTMKAYESDPDRKMEDLTAIPLIIAGWFRYLIGIDDSGESYTPSPDPYLEKMQEALKGFAPGDGKDYGQVLTGLLNDESIFGLNLSASPLGDRIIRFFAKMMEGPGAVRKTVEENV